MHLIPDLCQVTCRQMSPGSDGGGAEEGALDDSGRELQALLRRQEASDEGDDEGGASARAARPGEGDGDSVYDDDDMEDDDLDEDYLDNMVRALTALGFDPDPGFDPF